MIGGSVAKQISVETYIFVSPFLCFLYPLACVINYMSPASNVQASAK